MKKVRFTCAGKWKLQQQPSCTGSCNAVCAKPEDARQAGVELSLSTSGAQWLLKLTGLQEPMPSVLEHALKMSDAS